jgi:hypothetical protein
MLDSLDHARFGRVPCSKPEKYAPRNANNVKMQKAQMSVAKNGEMIKGHSRLIEPVRLSVCPSATATAALLIDYRTLSISLKYWISPSRPASAAATPYFFFAALRHVNLG